MEAKDTYILGSKNKLMVLSCHDDLSRELWVDALISEQAEISFKAGIKEVVDWVQLVPPETKLPEGNMPHYVISIEQWQAKLKEWGLA